MAKITKSIVKAASPEIERQRGGAIWAFNRFRESALTAFLDDLVLRRDLGFTQAECDRVKQALDLDANRLAELPDGSFWGGSLLAAFENFQKQYANWNSHEGQSARTAAGRAEAMKKLRRARQKLARRARKTQHVLANDLDLRLVDLQYTALEKLVEALPDAFKNLAKAVEQFRKLIPAGDG